MTTFAEFQALVRSAVRRGNALDTEIANAAKAAIRFIEQNYNLPYMRKKLTQSVTSAIIIDGDDGQYLKSVQFVRWVDSGGCLRWIRQIDPDQLVSTNGLFPSGYEHLIESDAVGALTHTLTFDVPFAEVTDVEVMIYRYTAVNLANAGAANYWLVNNAEGALLARTMINLAPIMREPQVMQMYMQNWNEEQKTLMAAAYDLEQGNR